MEEQEETAAGNVAEPREEKGPEPEELETGGGEEAPPIPIPLGGSGSGRLL